MTRFKAALRVIAGLDVPHTQWEILIPDEPKPIQRPGESYSKYTADMNVKVAVAAVDYLENLALDLLPEIRLK